MRIAFDMFNFRLLPPCGIKTYAYALIEALGALKTADELQLITYWKKKLHDCGPFAPYSNIVLKNVLPHPLLLGKQLSFLIDFASIYFERQVAKQCDLFHFTSPVWFSENIPNSMTTIHDLIPLRNEPWTQPDEAVKYRGTIATVTRKTRLIFADSEFTQNEIIQQFPEAAHKTTVVPLAASPLFSIINCDRTFLKHYGIDDINRPYLLYVGQIHPRKNVLEMLKVFESLGARNRSFRFILIGQASKGPYPQEVYTYAAHSVDKNRIHFLNTVSDQDLVRFYNHAHGMVYYSLSEGFGLPIIEAMKCGCPVATSRSSSLTEIAEGAAIMADPANFEEMRHGLVELTENDSLRAELRQKGFKRAEMFSWKRTAELTLAGYAKALALR